MDEVFKDPVQLSKGINLKDLMNSEAEFHIDVDFKKKEQDSMVNIDNDLLSDDEDDSDTEDALKNIEDSVNTLMLSSPEYHSFTELGAKMVDCVPSGKVKMLIIEEGDGPLVPLDADVMIHYAAYWEKASIPFDSSLTMNNGAPVRLRLGSGRILPGLDIGLTSVKGPTARLHLLLHPEATWGARGAPPRIKAETSLFVVHLYGWTDTGAGHRFNDLPSTEQSKYEVTIKTVNSLHIIAKDLFTKGKYMKAIKNYQQSLSVLNVSEPKNEKEEADVKTLKTTAYINLAVCYYKISKPKYVLIMLENLDRIIDVENHCKAMFYYGRAYEMLNRVDEAITYYKKALKLEPKNKEIGKTLAQLDAREKNAAKTEKVMWKTAFNAEEKKETKISDVDVDFLSTVRDMCQDLVGRTEYAKFDLTPGLTRNEVDCIKALVDEFQGLTLIEDGDGRRKKLSIVRKV